LGTRGKTDEKTLLLAARTKTTRDSAVREKTQILLRPKRPGGKAPCRKGVERGFHRSAQNNEKPRLTFPQNKVGTEKPRKKLGSNKKQPSRASIVQCGA